MKKIVSIILASLLIVSVSAGLTACGPTNDENVISILENDVAKEYGYLDYLLNAFNEEYADEGITAIDANLDEHTDLAQDGPYGYGPDVLYQANDAIMKYVSQKHVFPLEVEEWEAYDKISAASWDAYRATVEGKEYICGVPVNIQQPLLFYRKDLLPSDWETNWDQDNDGICDIVQYWTEMYRYSKQIRTADKSKYGFAMAMSNEYFNVGFLYSYGAYLFGDHNKDDSDIGLNKSDAKLGAQVIHQISGLIDATCIDDSITKSRDTKMASGDLFATITTPDTTVAFIKNLTATYKKTGLSDAEAKAKAEENLVIANLPKLPKSGDLTNAVDVTDKSLWIESKTMGGINGYAMSSYSKNKEASIKFIQFATSKEMIAKRYEYLGIVPARSDVAATTDQLTVTVLDNLNKGIIDVMPSITAVSQIWKPLSTGLKKIATDATNAEPVYDIAALQGILDEICSAIRTSIDAFKTGA